MYLRSRLDELMTLMFSMDGLVTPLSDVPPRLEIATPEVTD